METIELRSITHVGDRVYRAELIDEVGRPRTFELRMDADGSIPVLIRDEALIVYFNNLSRGLKPLMEAVFAFDGARTLQRET